MYGAIDLSQKKSTLFIPRLPEEYRIWCGTIHPPSSFQVSYGVDEVFYVDSLCSWLKDLFTSSPEAKLHLMDGVNSDSGTRALPASFDGDKYFYDQSLVDTSVLYNLLAHCRVTKSEAEIEVMRYCAIVASNAHAEVMRQAKLCEFEYELEAAFQHHIYRYGGCRKCAYTCICACGPNAAVLHYGHAAAPNDRPLESTDMVLKYCISFYTNLSRTVVDHCC